MGLLLSVLVLCVGAVELLDFISNVRGRIILTQRHRNELAAVRQNYVRGLVENLAETKTDAIPHIRLTCDSGAEDVELEFARNVPGSDRSGSPRRTFLVDQAQEGNNSSRSLPLDQSLPEYSTPLRCKKSRYNSPRRFLEDQQLPGYSVREATPPHENSQERLFIVESSSNEEIFPLPERFVVTEEFRRSPSPYPNNFDFTAPRGSVCSESLNASSVTEVDEDLYRSKSPTPEKLDVILERTNFNTTEYWTNKVLVVPSKSTSRSRSKSPDVRSKSTNDLTDGENASQIDGKLLDSLDGLDRNKLSYKGGSRRSFKKKKPPQADCNVVELKVAETSNEPSSSGENLKKATTEEERGKTGGDKKGEPFWVNQN